jgi:hypothetical protein
MRLWVDNSLLIDSWASLSSLTPTAVMQFPVANAIYDLRVDYWERNSASSNSQLQLTWNGAVIVSSRLFRTDFALLPSPMNVTVAYDIPSLEWLALTGSGLTIATAGKEVEGKGGAGKMARNAACAFQVCV